MTTGQPGDQCHGHEGVGEISCGMDSKVTARIAEIVPPMLDHNAFTKIARVHVERESDSGGVSSSDQMQESWSGGELDTAHSSPHTSTHHHLSGLAPVIED